MPTPADTFMPAVAAETEIRILKNQTRHPPRSRQTSAHDFRTHLPSPAFSVPLPETKIGRPADELRPRVSARKSGNTLLHFDCSAGFNKFLLNCLCFVL